MTESCRREALARCDAEIERLLATADGHADKDYLLLMGLADWTAERDMLLKIPMPAPDDTAQVCRNERRKR